MVIEEAEELRLRRWKGQHEVYVWRTWEEDEGGVEWFEELARVMGAEITGTERKIGP